jgi:hypothetical protein
MRIEHVYWKDQDFSHIIICEVLPHVYFKDVCVRRDALKRV